ncbi:hypothetical protein [Paraburkholderia sp. BL21I4N1]|uniref:hypothetical protein n=1 Tax=Paraburkholderia sp. BL21I4N1 TaxID=1938801 RepID=UPI000CFD29E2|nr:hypothetical protein [Paraburkholderia sp. BL21I4N1]PQV52141.1 hypothetical protein B0G83_104358 [Paraburkholderia sp. BL21I4N1]
MTTVGELHTKNLEAMVPAASSTWTSLGGAFRGIAAPVYYGGSLYAFTRNTDNTLGMCTVTSPTTGSWMQLGGQLTNSPASAISPNGTLGVLGLMQGNVVEINYVNPFQGTQTGFSNFAGGTPSGVSWSGAPVMTVNSNNRLEAFMLDSNGNMWHTYQTSVGTNPTWSNWSVLGSTFLVGASFQVFLNTNTGALQAVAIGTNNQIYQMTQYQGGGRDGWSSPALVGTLPSVTPQFTLGTAAAFNPGTSYSVFSGFNSQSGVSANPLMYSSGSYSNGTWVNLTVPDSPITTSAPLMLSNAGTPQLIYQSQTNPGQVVLLSQNTASTSFWKGQQQVGAASGDLSGQMSGVINAGNVALFQCGQSKGQLYFINYLPS